MASPPLWPEFDVLLACLLRRTASRPTFMKVGDLNLPKALMLVGPWAFLLVGWQRVGRNCHSLANRVRSGLRRLPAAQRWSLALFTKERRGL